MRTRTVQIVIEENADGQKRKVGRIYEAQALLVMDPETAGRGLLAILSQLVQQLDSPDAAALPGKQQEPPKAVKPANTDENPVFRKPKLMERRTQRKD